MPETYGMSLEGLDQAFEARVPARKFKHFKPAPPQVFAEEKKEHVSAVEQAS